VETGLDSSQLAEALRGARLEREAVEKELEKLSYSVSHDLRAPLRAIDGFSRILEEDYGPKLDEEGRRLLGIVRDNSRRMAQLLEALLEYSRLGRKPLADNEIDMDRIAQEVLKEAAARAPRPPDLLSARLPPARGDEALVRRVWANLLGNAVKFSGAREQPLVEVSGHEDGTHNVYCIRDNGVGFDMQYYDRLFGLFQRLHPERDFPGTGVGLAIVQRVVTRHGGRVWAEGRPEEGATFYFSLPKREARG
jgi:light-regulated signal transduction histidine kinase (bacteriophytochrome)